MNDPAYVFLQADFDTYRRQGGCGLNLLCRYCMK
jgi:hypothetical protein